MGSERQSDRLARLGSEGSLLPLRPEISSYRVSQQCKARTTCFGTSDLQIQPTQWTPESPLKRIHGAIRPAAFCRIPRSFFGHRGIQAIADAKFCAANLSNPAPLILIQADK